MIKSVQRIVKDQHYHTYLVVVGNRGREETYTLSYGRVPRATIGILDLIAEDLTSSCVK